MTERTCKICNAAVTGYRLRYCSEACRLEGYRARWLRYTLSGKGRAQRKAWRDSPRGQEYRRRSNSERSSSVARCVRGSGKV